VAQIRWTLQALDDLEAIADFIAADSPHYSNLFVLDVFRAVERLAEFPLIGRPVPEIARSEVRELLLGNIGSSIVLRMM
jgi:toxin ParE1/3/4